MSYLDDEEYERGTVFTQAQLVALTENLVIKWLNHKVYGVPGSRLEHPLICSNTIKYWKKVLSLFYAKSSYCMERADWSWKPDQIWKAE